MKNQITFTPSTSVSFNTIAGISNTFTLPPVDPSNPDTLIQNNGGDSVYLSFGSGAVVGPQVSGVVRVDGGQSLLLTNTVASASSGVLSGNQATSAATSISVTAMSGMGGQPVTISRGTATTRLTF